MPGGFCFALGLKHEGRCLHRLDPSQAVGSVRRLEVYGTKGTGSVLPACTSPCLH
jgi:hypothetical protein